MNKTKEFKVRYLILSLLILVTQAIGAETRYISDGLEVFLRSGPTNQYRIVGTLSAGDKIELLGEDAENAASRIRLNSGREVWIDTKHLMSDKPKHVLLDEVRKELQQLQRSTDTELRTLRSDLMTARELAGASEKLQGKVLDLEYRIELLSQQNQVLSDSSRDRLLTAGGIVALFGLILGLVLPKILQRKRSDGWR